MKNVSASKLWIMGVVLSAVFIHSLLAATDHLTGWWSTTRSWQGGQLADHPSFDYLDISSDRRTTLGDTSLCGQDHPWHVEGRIVKRQGGLYFYEENPDGTLKPYYTASIALKGNVMTLTLPESVERPDMKEEVCELQRDKSPWTFLDIFGWR
jgi:hypothetical protein